MKRATNRKDFNFMCEIGRQKFFYYQIGNFLNNQTPAGLGNAKNNK
jgi:hypothetical protein